jgi:Ca2+-transporting ATPase
MDARGAMLDESVLTGESIAVDKREGDEAFSGTLLVRGKAYLEVTRTGRSSAMGRLAAMLGDIQAAKTPLERRVDQLGRQIARWVLVLTVALGVVGIVAEGIGRAPTVIIFAALMIVGNRGGRSRERNPPAVRGPRERRANALVRCRP